MGKSGVELPAMHEQPLNMSDSEEQEVTMTMIPVEDLEYIVGIGNDALAELKNLRKKGIWINDPRVYEFLQKLGDKKLHELLFDIEEESEECCIHCKKCGGCDCAQQRDQDSLVAYV